MRLDYQILLKSPPLNLLAGSTPGPISTEADALATRPWAGLSPLRASRNMWLKKVHHATAHKVHLISTVQSTFQ